MKVKSIKNLKKVLQGRVDIALKEDVTDVVRDVMTDHIVTDVYEKYSPKTYQRRENCDGLLDPNNISSSVDNGKLSVKNDTLGSKYYNHGNEIKTSQNYNKPIADVIETGKGYDIEGWEYDNVPRPFMSNTYDDLQKNKHHIEAMRNGLRKQGLKVK